MNYKAIIEEAKVEINDLRNTINQWGTTGAELHKTILSTEEKLKSVTSERDELYSVLNKITCDRDLLAAKIAKMEAKELSLMVGKPVKDGILLKPKGKRG